MCALLPSRLHNKGTNEKAPAGFQQGLFLYSMPGDDRLLHGYTTLSLALNGFTSEFGMGSGGTHLLLSPGNIRLIEKSFIHLPKQLGCYMVKFPGQLVLVS